MAELKALLTEWMGIPKVNLESHSHLASIHSFLPISCGEIDEFIAFDADTGIAIELKDRWKTSPGQLKQYFEFAASNYKLPYLLFITQSPDDIQHRWIAPLFQNPRWFHRTWSSLSQYLQTSDLLRRNKGSILIIDYLASLGLNNEIRRPARDYGLKVDLPEYQEVNLDNMTQITLPDNGPLGCWASGIDFWEDAIKSIRGQTGITDFFSFRFDFYHYMFRWAFHERRVFFDMRKDNRWEYYYDYFVAHMEKALDRTQRVTMATWYDKYLKIGRNKFVLLRNSIIGVIRVSSENCYFVATKGENRMKLQRLNFWETISW